MRFLVVLLAVVSASSSFAADFPKFKVQEIDTGLKIGYAVLVVDINGDKKPDIVVVDQHKVVWYENPGRPGADWKKRIILDGKTKPDNVCAAAIDIDGDGLPELVLGSAWKPSDTSSAAQLGWLKRGKSLDEEWTYYPIPCDEPTVHRVRVADIGGSGKPSVIVAPLQGRDCTAKGNWTDGRPVRIVAYKVPAKDPEKKENWKPEVICDELHVVHNVWPLYLSTEGHPPVIRPRNVSTGGPASSPEEILVASYEGVYSIGRGNGKWTTTKLGEGNQANPMGSRGASEIKYTKLPSGDPVIATIEPWHGNQVVVYTPPAKVGKDKLWDRHVIDDHLRWGHAVWCADLDGDGTDEIIVGVRDDPNPKDTFKERRGVRIYKNTDGKGKVWERMILEDGGVAVEDLVAADLDCDGKIDIVAVGRQTGNARIYWNQGK
jgi:hypothetical protein